MSIDLGEDYKNEATLNMQKARAGSRKDARQLFWTVAIVLAAWIGAAHLFSLPDGLIISATIAIATMCLIWVLNDRTASLETDIIYTSGAVEWFGQKYLDLERARDLLEE